MKWINNFYEPITGRYFRAPMVIVNKKIDEFNAMLKKQQISMNDALAFIGLSKLNDSRAEMKLNIGRVAIGIPKIEKEKEYYYPIVYYDRKGREAKWG